MTYKVQCTKMFYFNTKKSKTGHLPPSMNTLNRATFNQQFFLSFANFYNLKRHFVLQYRKIFYKSFHAYQQKLRLLFWLHSKLWHFFSASKRPLIHLKHCSCSALTEFNERLPMLPVQTNNKQPHCHFSFIQSV